MERYQEILNEEDLPKPELPEDFDENAVREQIKAKFLSIRRRPGEMGWMMCVCVFGCMHVCACMCACMHVCVCVCVFARACMRERGWRQEATKVTNTEMFFTSSDNEANCVGVPISSK